MKLKTLFRNTAILIASAALVLAPAGAAWASEDTEIVENGGNMFGASASVPEDVTKAVDHDFYWAGSNLSFSDIQAGGSILIAGANIDLNRCVADGSVRVAGAYLTLNDVTAGDNFTCAAGGIDLVNCNAEGGVYCAGKHIKFSGSAKGAFLAGDDVYLDGVIDGDAYISGNSVKIGPNANITGSIKVYAPVEPEIHPNAKFGDYLYTQTGDGADAAAAGAALGSAVLAGLIIAKVIGIFGTIVFAILFVWLLRRPVESASAMTRVHAGRIFATGAIAAIAAPIAIALLFCLVITAPVALALIFALLTLTFAAVPFAAASFAQMVFPKMNRFGAAAIGGAVLGIAAAIPFLGTIIGIAAFIYIAGYVIQTAWNARKPEVLPEPAVQATETADAIADPSAADPVVVAAVVDEETI